MVVIEFVYSLCGGHRVCVFYVVVVMFVFSICGGCGVCILSMWWLCNLCILCGSCVLSMLWLWCFVYSIRSGRRVCVFSM